MEKKTIKNDHKSVLVPLETWEYNSPYLKYLGKPADIGLFAESFIYYEKVYVNITTVKEFENFVDFFARGDKIVHLIELVKNKIINFFYYSFMSTAINNQGEFSIWNVQAPRAYNQSDFIRLVVNRANLRISSKRRSQLWRAIVDNLVDENSKDYESPVLDAKEAVHDEQKCTILIQAYVDNIYKKLKLGNVPKIECKIVNNNSESWNINTNFNFHNLDKFTDNKLNFRPEMPLIGEVNSNRLIWSSLVKGYDLFLGDVMGQIVGNKLEEAERKINKPKEIITDLKSKVEFPDIREGVNNESITVEDVFNIRIHANKFREWLQQEGERDRDAILAYHNEVSKSSGITKKVSSTLKIFGTITQNIAPAAYQAITKDVSSTSSLVVSGVATTIASFLNQVADSIDQEWRPIVFGEWVKKELNLKNKRSI